MSGSISGVGEVANLAGSIIDRLWPNKSEQERAEMQAALLVVQGQLDVNKAEAASSDPFTSRWRPFIGWVCGAACAWNWIGLPIVKTALMVFGVQLAVAPADLTEMLPILMSMLGLGGYRTFEKVRGVTK